MKGGAPFTAELCRLDGAAIDEARLATGKMAEHAVQRIRDTAFRVASVERDTLRRRDRRQPGSAPARARGRVCGPCRRAGAACDPASAPPFRLSRTKVSSASTIPASRSGAWRTAARKR